MTELKKPSEKERFSARWAKRKQRVKLEQDTPEAEPDDTLTELITTEKATSEAADAERIRAEKLAQLNTLEDKDMPDIALLDENSDFSQFMSTNVSEALRKLALHKLFHSEGYNIRDGLDEYDGDYTSFEKLDPTTITADMRYRQELDAEKLKARLEKEALEDAELLADNDAETQADTAELQDETTRLDNSNEADSVDALDPVNKPAEAAQDIEPATPQQAAGQITPKTKGEKQT